MIELKPFSWVQDYIEQLARDNPENAMVPDQYFYSDGRPCCIVGHVFHALGARYVEGDDNHYVAAPNGECVVSEGTIVAEADWRVLGVEPPNSAQGHWIQNVQYGQDAGESWDRAVFGQPNES